MSNSSPRSRPRLLVDTSFLLPAIGIDTEKEVVEAIKYFPMAEIYYLEASILEAMWKIVKVVPADKIDRVGEGVEAIMNTYRLATPNSEAYLEAYRLYHEGHRDYIDNLLYATSRKLNLFLLTIDEEFIDFLKEKGHFTDNIITPIEMERLVKGRKVM